MTELKKLLKKLGACKEAVEWVGDRDLQTAWKDCERGDWMLWLCAKKQGERGWPTRQQIVLVACECAELTLPIFEKKFPDDTRVKNCIEITRKWALGEASINEVWSARNAAAAAYAAAAAAYAAAYAAAADAAYAAAYAACRKA